MKNMEYNNFQGVRTTSRDSSVGLVCHYQFENGSSQFLFLDDAENGAVLNHSLSFFTENFVQSLASSNGLILLSGYSVDQPCYYVFNSHTKNSHMIPQASTLGRIIRIGLAYDGSQFEVVIVEAGSSSESNGLELHIFSSGTGSWSRKHLTDLTLPSLPEFEFQELGTPPLYSNGAIHWEIAGIMRTICNYSYAGINFNCCKFLPLIASGVTNGTREVDLLPKEQMELNLPIAEMETLSL
ncbi:hypothetical protein AHAS_Ahas13G0433500 [Arachis hypogaea]